MGLIPKDHLNNICKIGQYEQCCRYITAGPEGICCEKLNNKMKHILDMRVHNMVAKGDNCQGV